MESGQQSDVEALVRENIHGVGSTWTMPEGDGCAVALAQDGTIAGCLVMGLGQVGDDFLAIIQHLVVDPEFRGRGIGTVLLGIAPQLVRQFNGGATAHWLGQCEESMRSFYAAAGFTALQPDEPISLPFAKGLVGNGNPEYNCWFYSQR
ncbi:GNAT family N-acetyltransferase [Gordonia sp. 852002-51296_SCH5728562-b]|uniref:GNAT family N-acetyltransferase n=1 Tax=Gordonia sp. 852002-51296_SCH5728562-b TaxID=1834101 RepID=UPI0009EEC300|nr:GNAT family N-acetyltransferase [Gordonia sp. 852002-51296_SCH5728562-b]